MGWGGGQAIVTICHTGEGNVFQIVEGDFSRVTGESTEYCHQMLHGGLGVPMGVKSAAQKVSRII